MGKEFHQNSATGEISVDPDWKPFPETAPKDRQILVFGRWKGDQEICGKIVHFPGGGEPAYELACWGSYHSNPRLAAKDSDWMGGGLGGSIMRHNVKWTHWMELPVGP